MEIGNRGEDVDWNRRWCNGLVEVLIKRSAVEKAVGEGGDIGPRDGIAMPSIGNTSLTVI